MRKGVWFGGGVVVGVALTVMLSLPWMGCCWWGWPPELKCPCVSAFVVR